MLSPYLCFILFHIMICMYQEIIHWQVIDLSCKPNSYVSWNTSEINVRFVLLSMFKQSNNLFYWPFLLSIITFSVIHVYFIILSCLLFLAAMWSQQICFILSEGSYFAFCIDSWSLHPYLLTLLFALCIGQALNVYLTTKETWHILCVNYFGSKWIRCTIVCPLHKVEQR